MTRSICSLLQQTATPMTRAPKPETLAQAMPNTSPELRRASELYERARGAINAYAIDDAMGLLDQAETALADDRTIEATEVRLRIAISRTWLTFATAPEATQLELDRIAAEAGAGGLAPPGPTAGEPLHAHRLRRRHRPRRARALRCRQTRRMAPAVGAPCVRSTARSTVRRHAHRDRTLHHRHPPAAAG